MIKTKLFKLDRYRMPDKKQHLEYYDIQVCHYIFGIMVWSIQLTQIDENSARKIFGWNCSFEE